MRQARADQRDWRFGLGRLMNGCEQRAELRFGDILQLVDEQDERRLFSLRRAPDLEQKLGEVVLQIAAVGDFEQRGDVEIDLDVGVFDLQRLGESGEKTSALAPAPNSMRLKWSSACLRAGARSAGNDRRSGASDDRCNNSRRLRLAADRIEQHRLADAAQTVEHEAARRAAGSNAVESDFGAFEQRASPRQFRRFARRRARRG